MCIPASQYLVPMNIITRQPYLTAYHIPRSRWNDQLYIFHSIIWLGNSHLNTLSAWKKPVKLHLPLLKYTSGALYWSKCLLALPYNILNYHLPALGNKTKILQQNQHTNDKVNKFRQECLYEHWTTLETNPGFMCSIKQVFTDSNSHVATTNMVTWHQRTD